MIKYQVIGLMSGTSLDGLDIVHCEFENPGEYWKYRINKCKTVPYNYQWTQDLKKAIFLSPEELAILHIRYGDWIGEQVNRFIGAENLKVDLISSHGHTIHHQPDEGITVQIGHGQHIADRTGIETICDFRVKDVILGGQGAPLVPIGDQLLFGDFDYCVNLGGICNVSYNENGERIAFDVGIANMLLNYLAETMGHPYDDKGKFAASGHLDEKLFESLNGLPYYQRKPPKSTGYEWFHKEIKPLVDQNKSNIPDKLHTATVHVAHQLALQLEALPNKEVTNVLITGGGAFNDFLIAELRKRIPDNIQLFIPDDKLVSFKEALVFAFMGVLRKEETVNVLHSVTGALEDSCSGEIFIPGN